MRARFIRALKKNDKVMSIDYEIPGSSMTIKENCNKKNCTLKFERKDSSSIVTFDTIGNAFRYIEDNPNIIKKYLKDEV